MENQKGEEKKEEKKDEEIGVKEKKGEEKVPLLKGFLQKKDAQGLLKGWKKRQFVLYGKILRYYDHTKEVGAIYLECITEIAEVSDREFHIITKNRTYVLRAEDKEKLKYWVEGLRARIPEKAIKIHYDKEKKEVVIEEYTEEKKEKEDSESHSVDEKKHDDKDEERAEEEKEEKKEENKEMMSEWKRLTLSQALPRLRDNSISRLNLRGNLIGAEGAKEISKSLLSNNSLKQLDLYENNIGDEGAKEISKSLLSNTSLTQLHLGENNIGDEGAKEISKSLLSNNSLTQLHLGWNNIGEKTFKEVEKELEGNYIIREDPFGGRIIKRVVKKELSNHINLNNNNNNVNNKLNENNNNKVNNNNVSIVSIDQNKFGDLPPQVSPALNNNKPEINNNENKLNQVINEIKISSINNNSNNDNIVEQISPSSLSSNEIFKLINKYNNEMFVKFINFSKEEYSSKLEEQQKEIERLNKEIIILNKLRKIIYPKDIEKEIFQTKYKDIWTEVTINNTFEEKDFNDLLLVIEKSLILRSAKLSLFGFSDDQINQIKKAWENSLRSKKNLQISTTDSLLNNYLHLSMLNLNPDVLIIDQSHDNNDKNYISANIINLNNNDNNLNNKVKNNLNNNNNNNINNNNNNKGKFELKKYNEVIMNEKNHDGNIPLHILFQNYHPNYFNIAKNLIENGSNLNSINRNGQTPLLTFCKYFNANINNVIDSNHNNNNNNNNNIIDINIDVMKKSKNEVMELLLLKRQKISKETIERVIKSTTSIYRNDFQYMDRNNRAIDRNLFQLIGKFEKKIKEVVRNEKYKYFGNFEGLSGNFKKNGNESNFESFKAEEFFIIQSRIVLHMIVDLKRVNQPPSIGYSIEEIEKLLIEEFAQLLELYHTRTNYLIANENANREKIDDPLPDWAIRSIAKNIQRIIIELKIGERYVYNAGSLKHSFYILFIKKNNNNNNIIQVIYVNLGMGVINHHRYTNDKNHPKYNYYFPYVFDINSEEELENFLKVVIANRNSLPVIAINNLYNFKPQLDIQSVRNLFKNQEKKEQSSNNCVFENYKSILSLKWSEKFISWFYVQIMSILLSKINPHNSSITINEYNSENFGELHKEINLELFLYQQLKKIEDYNINNKMNKNINNNYIEEILKQTSIGIFKLHNYSPLQISILFSDEDHVPDEIINSNQQTISSQKLLLEFALLHKKLAIANYLYNSLSSKQISIQQILNEENSHGDSLKALLSIKIENIIEIDEVTTIKRLGEGGNSIVYLGSWINKCVVIKKLHKIPSDSKEITIRRFHREAAIGCKLNHPNIIKHYAYTPFHPYYIILEYMNQQDLNSFLKKNQNLSKKEKLFICIQITKGLDYLHSVGIVHRDLKTSNILVNEKERMKGGKIVKEWEFKISDFGIAKIVNEEGNATNSHSDFQGSCRYWSPELANGSEPFSRSTDVYALAVIFWEIFTSLEPFAQYKNTFQVVALILESAKLNKFPLIIPNELPVRHLIEECWKINANDRPSTKQILSLLDEIPINNI